MQSVKVASRSESCNAGVNAGGMKVASWNEIANIDSCNGGVKVAKVKVASHRSVLVFCSALAVPHFMFVAVPKVFLVSCQQGFFAESKSIIRLAAVDDKGAPLC